MPSFGSFIPSFVFNDILQSVIGLSSNTHDFLEFSALIRSTVNCHILPLLEQCANAGKKDLVIITYYKNTPLYDKLVNEYKIDSDPRIKFVGTLYDEQLLKKVRENAYAYIHGHSVGGTNPSLLEALGRTDVNLVYDVSFNKEVAKDGAIYWSEEYALLRNLIKRCDEATIDKRYELGLQAKARIEGAYTWDKVIDQYEELFLEKEQTAENSNS